MKGLKPFLFFALLSLVTLFMISNAYGQMSQQDAMNQVQQQIEAGVITNVSNLILDSQVVSVTVGINFHDMTAKQKYDFAVLLSLAYPWQIIAVTDGFTGAQFFTILGCPAK